MDSPDEDMIVELFHAHDRLAVISRLLAERDRHRAHRCGGEVPGQCEGRPAGADREATNDRSLLLLSSLLARARRLTIPWTRRHGPWSPGSGVGGTGGTGCIPAGLGRTTAGLGLATPTGRFRSGGLTAGPRLGAGDRGGSWMVATDMSG